MHYGKTPGRRLDDVGSLLHLTPVDAGGRVGSRGSRAKVPFGRTPFVVSVGLVGTTGLVSGTLPTIGGDTPGTLGVVLEVLGAGVPGTVPGTVFGTPPAVAPGSVPVAPGFTVEPGKPAVPDTMPVSTRPIQLSRNIRARAGFPFQRLWSRCARL